MMKIVKDESSSSLLQILVRQFITQQQTLLRNRSLYCKLTSLTKQLRMNKNQMSPNLIKTSLIKNKTESQMLQESLLKMYTPLKLMLMSNNSQIRQRRRKIIIFSTIGCPNKKNWPKKSKNMLVKVKTGPKVQMENLKRDFMTIDNQWVKLMINKFAKVISAMAFSSLIKCHNLDLSEAALFKDR